MFRCPSIAILCLAVPLFGQTFDFENGIAEWNQSGKAFRNQPFCQKTLSTTFAAGKLGGNYWQGLEYPLGQHGSCFVTSIAKPFDSPTGSLTSPTFLLDPQDPFLSFRIGGTEDPAHERLEMQVRVAGADTALTRRIRDWAWRASAVPLHSDEAVGDDGYLTVYAATGHETNALRQEVVEIPEFLHGLEARFRVVDDSATGHINVDYIRFAATAPPPLRVPVFGFADYHTHPMSYMALGGMKGIRSLWGVPGGDVDDYADPNAITVDIPHCVHGHGGGYFAEAFIDGSELAHYDLPSVLHAILFPHRHHGGPEFNNFPDHLQGAHEQLHITMIRRSYDGGQRLMVALATDNKAAQFLTGRVANWHMDIVGEKESMEAQLAGMKRMAELNRKWMEIAYSSADARRIIQHNKLAIVLGVEMDQLGDIPLGGGEADEPRLEADYLWGLGARAVIPIHAVDNRVGSPVVWIGPYNWLNDYLHRRNPDATTQAVRQTPAVYFEVTGDPSCDPDPKRHVGECVLNQLDSKLQVRLGLGRPIFNWLRPGPDIFFVPRQRQFETTYGNKNAKGLEPFGRNYIAALMDRGMILDTAHMSDRSIVDTYSEIGKRLAVQHPGCDGFAFGSRPDPGCDADAYPAIISHAHFRGQAIYDTNLKVEDYWPAEYDISDRHLKMLQRTGGVVGPFVAQVRVAQSNIAGIVDDCGNSSKDFAFSFRYGAERVNTGADEDALASRVGFATDMTFVSMVSPRFGEHACEGYKVVKNGSRVLRDPVYRQLHQPGAQSVQVPYVGAWPQDRYALEPYRMGQRIYNFNSDGLAHYGLLPDMLQDVAGLGDAQDIRTLFRSAEGYLQMWEKVERLRGHVEITR
jgi:microsomal dipeptidase-like Zn-dependent dipeptidase